MHGRRRLAVLAIAAVVCLVTVWQTVVVYAAEAPKVQKIPKGAKYIGTKKCRSCHLKQHKTYRKSKHYKTFDQLKDAEKKDPKCLKCHTTGYGKPGGFVSEDKTPDLKSTGCEACHGPGSAHAEAAKDAPEEGKWEDPNYPNVIAAACIGCHNPHVSHDEIRAKKK